MILNISRYSRSRVWPAARVYSLLSLRLSVLQCEPIGPLRVRVPCDWSSAVLEVRLGLRCFAVCRKPRHRGRCSAASGGTEHAQCEETGPPRTSCIFHVSPAEGCRPAELLKIRRATPITACRETARPTPNLCHVHTPHAHKGREWVGMAVSVFGFHANQL